MADPSELLDFLSSLVSQPDVPAAEPEVVALALHSRRQSLLHLLDYKVPVPVSHLKMSHQHLAYEQHEGSAE